MIQKIEIDQCELTVLINALQAIESYVPKNTGYANRQFNDAKELLNEKKQSLHSNNLVEAE